MWLDKPNSYTPRNKKASFLGEAYMHCLRDTLIKQHNNSLLALLREVDGDNYVVKNSLLFYINFCFTCHCKCFKRCFNKTFHILNIVKNVIKRNGPYCSNCYIRPWSECHPTPYRGVSKCFQKPLNHFVPNIL